MTSKTESFSPSKHTPLYENNQNKGEIVQWRLLQKPVDKTKKLTQNETQTRKTKDYLKREKKSF